MAGVRQSGTSAELSVRRLLQELGTKYKAGARDLPGSPDLIGRERKWAIFVHGCFWHAHMKCRRWKVPKANRAFWQEKFAQNRRRDRDNITRLKRMGYSVLVVWECELEHRDELRKKILSFLSSGDRKRAILTTTKKDRNGLDTTRVDKGKEGYCYRKGSVVRTVRLANGRKISTSIRAKISVTDPRLAFDYSYLRMRAHPRQPRDSNSIRFVDLFSGCGGLSLGATEACRAIGKRFLSVAALDEDPECAKVYERNLNCSRTFVQDIVKILDGQIGSAPTSSERFLLEHVGNVDVLLAGPPCQGNSDLNNQTRRDDPRNALYERVARFVELVKPKHILIENVPAAIHGKERAVQKTLEKIRTLGYHADCGIVDLSAIGVPQKRKRHIVVASRSKRLTIADVLTKYVVERTRSVRWAIGDLEKETPNSVFSRPTRHTPENIRRIRYLHRRSVFDLPNRFRPRCHRKSHSYKSMYGRLSMDEPAQTVTSGFGSPGQGRYVHPNRMRTLTPHEAARLQFFPDFFDFSGVHERGELASMIGNAAPMKLSYVFCLELLT